MIHMKYLLIGILVLGIGVVTYSVLDSESTDSNNKLKQVQKQLMQERSKILKSKYTKLLEAKDFNQFKEIYNSKNIEEVIGFLKSAIALSHKDIKEKWTKEELSYLILYTVDFIKSNYENARGKKARALSLSIQLLKLLPIEDIDGAKEKVVALSSIDLPIHLKNKLYEIFTSWSQVPGQVTSSIKIQIQSKDPRINHQGLQLLSQLKNSSIKTELINETVKNFDQMQPLAQSLALKILVVNKDATPIDFKPFIQKVANSDDPLLMESFIFAVEQLNLTNDYQNEIREVYQKVDNPFLQAKASKLLSRNREQ